MKKILQMSLMISAIVLGSLSTAAAADTKEPVITLLGEKVVTIPVGGTYTDPGATATDDQDPMVSVSRAGSFNAKKSGTYTLYYSAADGSGNVTGVARTVIVGSGKGSVLGASTFRFTQTLKVGSRGTQVRELQKYLKAKGYSRGGAIDGSFGIQTKNAVITMQQSNGIVPADGIVGVSTRLVLNK